MAKAREIPGLEPDMPFRDAAAAAVEVRAEEVFSHAANVLDTGDIERVHDMRVATRRLRAAMEIFAPCFPKGEHRAVLRDVKALADALGERRDPDVAIETLGRIESGLGDEDRPGIDSLVGEFHERQAAGNESLAAMLASVEEGELRERLIGLVASAKAG